MGLSEKLNLTVSSINPSGKRLASTVKVCDKGSRELKTFTPIPPRESTYSAPRKVSVLEASLLLIGGRIESIPFSMVW